MDPDDRNRKGSNCNNRVKCRCNALQANLVFDSASGVNASFCNGMQRRIGVYHLIAFSVSWIKGISEKQGDKDIYFDFIPASTIRCPKCLNGEK
jgi:hypothetical protein